MQAWNRLPQAKPTVKVTAKEVGLKSDGQVLQVQLNGPSYRMPTEFAVSWTGDTITLDVSRPAKVRLDYGILHPGWIAQGKVVLQRCRPGELAEVMRNDVVWSENVVEWQATPGKYELRIAGR